ncbi:uncharacterized protein [Venturia canescens]|uniref:uncharacterized protein n=1 Tax=Venturia canescens TaxID=32260 RepID=UPI001C9D4A7D|nr:uncharacterized protein LOC122417093 [Venturia canescens]
MSGQSRKFLQGIAARISKSPMVYSASTAIENASTKAQGQLTNLQNIATKKYDTIVKQVNGSTIIQDPNLAPLAQPAPIPKSLINVWRWYQQLTGLQDVEMAQHQVIAVQNKLFKCQDERRVLNHQAEVIAEKLKDVYGELVQIKREDPKYVQLTILENKGLQEQSRITNQLKLLENEERDHFTQLATAIKEYHDSQAMNAQKYKYLSILASATLAIISLCGSMIYNNRRIRDMRIAIAEAQIQNEQTFKDHFDSLEKIITEGLSREIVEIPHPQQETSNFFTTRNICIGVLTLLLSKLFW